MAGKVGRLLSPFQVRNIGRVMSMPSGIAPWSPNGGGRSVLAPSGQVRRPVQSFLSGLPS